MKIEQRDFYAAFHTLCRADKLDTEKSYLEKFRLFTEVIIGARVGSHFPDETKILGIHPKLPRNPIESLVERFLKASLLCLPSVRLLLLVEASKGP